MGNKDYSSIILSIFKRKGGEGKYTKILPQEVSANILSELESNEEILIFYYKNKVNYLLITNFRLFQLHEGDRIIVNHRELKSIYPAMYEEFSDGVLDMKLFTRIKLFYNNNYSCVVYIEEGEPFSGILQVLSFLANQNNE
ncbi:MAG: hypothetical protein R3E32_27295 [Chitinophagales bacterium]